MGGRRLPPSEWSPRLAEALLQSSRVVPTLFTFPLPTQTIISFHNFAAICRPNNLNLVPGPSNWAAEIKNNLSSFSAAPPISLQPSSDKLSHLSANSWQKIFWVGEHSSGPAAWSFALCPYFFENQPTKGVQIAF